MRFVRNLIVVIIIIITLSCRQEKSPARPNVLFVVVDDLGYKDLGCLGSDFYETPNIDQLAGKSTIFKQGYSTSAVCSPARASLITGMYTATHGVTDWIGAKSGINWRSSGRFTKMLPATYSHKVDADFVTLPEVFKKSGYKTFFAGKWHLGGEENGSMPTDHGFDINIGGYHAGGPYKGGYFSPFNNPYLKDQPEEKGMPLSMKLAKETKKFITENKNEPFFAFLAFYAVHAPIQTTKEKWKKYRQKAALMGIDSVGFEMERILPVRKHQDNPVYAGLIEQMDEAVGYVLNELKINGLEDQTIVVFTSDNGGVVSGDDFSTNLAPLRGGKGYQWEGGIRVPYFIYVPWLKNKISYVDTPVSGADFYPTLVELANLKPDKMEQIDGVSLVPLLANKSLKERPLFWHYPHYGNQGGEPNSIILKNNFKLIYYWEDQRCELYNLKSDISENRDISNEEPTLVNNLKKELFTWLKSKNAHYPELDITYNCDSTYNKMKWYNTTLRLQVEKRRMDQLDENYEPNADWWGSEIN